MVANLCIIAESGSCWGHIVGIVVGAGSREANLVGQLIGRLLVLPLYFDGVDDLLETAPVIQQAHRQQEEAQAIDAAHYAVESRQP